MSSYPKRLGLELEYVNFGGQGDDTVQPVTHRIKKQSEM